MLIGLDGARAILLWWTLPSFMTLIGTALVLCGVVLVWVTRRPWQMRYAVDSVLLAAAFGLTFARAEYVLLNQTYFSESSGEILTFPAGGLGAHGAILGALLGGYIASRLFKSPFDVWLSAAAFALPIMAFAAWWGCAASNCAYGAEVPNLSDYPSWLVWEAPGDFLAVAPRFAVQILGMVVSAAVLLNVLLASSRLSGRRLAGLALVGVCAASFTLGFMRGDTPAVIAGLSINQLADLVFIGAGIVMSLPNRRTAVPST